MIDTTALIESASPVSFDYISSKYDAILSLYSVRTNNVLQALADNYSDKHTFLEEFMKMSRKEIATLKNCGAKTIEEILAIQSILDPNHEGQHSDDVEIVQKTLPENIDTLLPLIMPLLEGVSVRAKNGFAIFLEENHNSLTELYAAVTNPKFNPVKIKKVGRTTVVEIKALLDRIRDYLDSFTDEQSVEAAITKFYTKTLDDLQIPVYAQEGLHELESTLGHFPLFAAINAYFEGLQGEDRIIINALFIIHEGQTPRDMDEVAAELGLSRERVRQKRNILVNALSEYFTTYRTLSFVDKCPYNYQMRRIHEDINAQEGTDFNLNFVNWVLASVFEEVSLIGDVVKTITGYYEKDYFLCLVPTDLCQFIDFSAFLEDVEARMLDKRINEEKVNLQSLISTHLKTQYCEDKIPAIETACRSILYLHYPIDVDFGQVIFKPNARKNNTIAIEEIIRAAGHPLTLEEIYDEFIYLYPERYTEMKSLRGSINSNRNIVPIGRSSTYTLTEWENEWHKGGSIRSIIAEYLGGLEPTIAPFTEVVEYVKQFRPTTEEKSVFTNISLDTSGTFTYYFFGGVRHIGLSANTYPPEYFPVEIEARSATAQSLWYPKLISFIEKNGRFPFSSSVGEDELKLCHFWAKQQRRFRDGELTGHALEIFESVKQRFGHLNLDKREFEWRQECQRFKDVLANNDRDSLTDDDWKWYERNLREYKFFKDSMPALHKEEMEFIVSQLNAEE